MYNFVIVGSGPSGIAAARRLEGHGTCIVDVGDLPDQEFPYPSLRSSLASGDIRSLLGSNWETLDNLIEPNRIHAKLRAPALGYVVRGEEFRVYDKMGEIILKAAGSYAAGGMSNAWGAQLFRYTDADLVDAGGWPVTADDLSQYYVDLEKHIGISGQIDDAFDFLGGASQLLPPAPLVPAAEKLLSRYIWRKTWSEAGALRLGRSRLAVLTKPLGTRPAHKFGETEFFSTESSGIYTARWTLNELCKRNKIEYLRRNKVISFRELSDFVEISLFDCDSGVIHKIRTRQLLLGCGTVQTARLVLMVRKDFGRPLPFIDHPPTLAPIFLPGLFGSPLPERSFPVQLVATLEGIGRRDMISFYYPGALLWSDLLPDIPLPMNAAVKMLGNLLGGMLVTQIWEVSRPEKENCLRIDGSGHIRIDYPERQPCSVLKPLLSSLRPLGAYSLSRLATPAPPGWGFHYAGCLPMRHHPNEYETHPDGRLWDSKRVRIIDGSALPSLPAKNHSLTMMANAARIADEALRCGY